MPVRAPTSSRTSVMGSEKARTRAVPMKHLVRAERWMARCCSATDLNLLSANSSGISSSSSSSSSSSAPPETGTATTGCSPSEARRFRCSACIERVGSLEMTYFFIPSQNSSNESCPLRSRSYSLKSSRRSSSDLRSFMSAKTRPSSFIESVFELSTSYRRKKGMRTALSMASSDEGRLAPVSGTASGGPSAAGIVRCAASTGLIAATRPTPALTVFTVAVRARSSSTRVSFAL
mmetsp:Transcript_21509/g.67482  ORF Transcript_21509/g.67482 Transcript_21509/m.67482 type:complete len:234 (+) Transcript_21509:685-1386(+)